MSAWWQHVKSKVLGLVSLELRGKAGAENKALPWPNWLGHMTSNHGIVGSSPAGSLCFLCLCLFGASGPGSPRTHRMWFPARYVLSAGEKQTEPGDFLACNEVALQAMPTSAYTQTKAGRGIQTPSGAESKNAWRSRESNPGPFQGTACE